MGAPTDLYASPAFHSKMFQAGEVRRSEASFEDWRLVCDELPRIRQKFCSLYSRLKTLSAKDAEAQSAAPQIIVSTSDGGGPAAMLRLPLGIYLPEKIEVGPKPQIGERRKADAHIRLNVLACDAVGCATVFPLSSNQIATLVARQNLDVAFFSNANRNIEFRMRIKEATAKRVFAISGAGFAEALQAAAR